MQYLFLKNIHTLVRGDVEQTVQHRIDLLCRGGEILRIGHDLDKESDSTGWHVIDARQLMVYPGLINTHHHFFQAFVRNRLEFDWSKLNVVQWLKAIYPLFSRVDEDCIYHSALVSMAELIKHGCTTAFDHQYNYSNHAGKYLIDRQIEAASLLGMRYHGGRGCNTLPMDEGSTIPGAMLETTAEFIADCERLIDHYHQPEPFGMHRIVVAPCQPINSYPETFREALALARDKGVSLHTHLGEGENAGMRERWGKRSLQWCEDIGFVGEDVWFAHGWEFSPEEIARLATTGTGLSHCPAPVYLVGAEITNIPQLYSQQVRVGLGVDGQASNDNSNLMECIRSAYLLQSLNAKHHADPLPPPSYYFEMATRGGAACLNRDDIGELSEGKAADFFAVQVDRLDYVATLQDPLSLLAKVGIGSYVDLTVINGCIAWRNGEFPGLDEAKLVYEANLVAQRLLN